ncbi:MAG: hypothetical protein ACXVCY_08885 [Pseudobdellovibrionaceae bacterium]
MKTLGLKKSIIAALVMLIVNPVMAYQPSDAVASSSVEVGTADNQPVHAISKSYFTPMWAATPDATCVYAGLIHQIETEANNTSCGQGLVYERVSEFQTSCVGSKTEFTTSASALYQCRPSNKRCGGKRIPPCVG